MQPHAVIRVLSGCRHDSPRQNCSVVTGVASTWPEWGGACTVQYSPSSHPERFRVFGVEGVIF